ncbi:hypothetical protein F0919_17790 [Taibaiella lutea]|uniref:Uncharacterized protein n=1 Tax=Taibaiella lutea TaxID=2608001 RepID=A0A5M6CBV4_9BACT|nr:hypothetical protein [Taibaiella lutea]KAA5532634.1 hypothetical protein F0919_17790 [Taibaiella lutea]
MEYPRLTLINQLPDVKMIEIFAPFEQNNRMVYPVTVDGLKTTFENTGIHAWTAKGFGLAFSQELIDYIGAEIEQFEI